MKHLFCYFFTPETFTDGVRYSVSVYACTQGAPVLLHSVEDYVRETSKFELFDFSVVHRQSTSNSVSSMFSIPGIKDGLFKSLKWKQQNSDVEVYWDHIDQREQSAFIQGYVLYWSGDDSSEIFRVSTGRWHPARLLFIYSLLFIPSNIHKSNQDFTAISDVEWSQRCTYEDTLPLIQVKLIWRRAMWWIHMKDLWMCL